MGSAVLFSSVIFVFFTSFFSAKFFSSLFSGCYFLLPTVLRLISLLESVSIHFIIVNFHGNQRISLRQKKKLKAAANFFV